MTGDRKDGHLGLSDRHGCLVHLSIRRGSIYGIGFGGDASDKPVPGDYDGGGKADIAIYRSGSWFILSSSTEAPYGIGFGGDPSDVPVILAALFLRREKRRSR